MDETRKRKFQTDSYSIGEAKMERFSVNDAARELGVPVDQLQDELDEVVIDESYETYELEKAHEAGISQRSHRGSTAAYTRGRPVIVYETGERFDSAKAAAKALGVTPSSVFGSIGLRGTCRGVHLLYEDEKETYVPRQTRRRENGRPVICTDTGERFDSVLEAAAWAGVKNGANITNAIARGGTCGGHRFAYADELERYEAVKENPEGKRSIIIYETGESFPSVTAAARAFGVSAGWITEAAIRHSTCKGYHILYEDEKETYEPRQTRRGRSGRPVICTDTGDRFGSLTEAAAWAGVKNAANITNAIASNGTCGTPALPV